MQVMVIQGVIRGKAHRTTIQEKKQPCPLDKVNRQFRVPPRVCCEVVHCGAIVRADRMSITCPTPEFRQTVGIPVSTQERFATNAYWDHLIAPGSDLQLAAMLRYAEYLGFSAGPEDLTRAKAAVGFIAKQQCPDISNSPLI